MVVTTTNETEFESDYPKPVVVGSGQTKFLVKCRTFCRGQQRVIHHLRPWPPFLFLFLVLDNDSGDLYDMLTFLPAPTMLISIP